MAWPRELPAEPSESKRRQDDAHRDNALVFSGQKGRWDLGKKPACTQGDGNKAHEHYAFVGETKAVEGAVAAKTQDKGAVKEP